MAWQLIDPNGNVLKVGGPMLSAAHVHLKPIEYVLGHYQVSGKFLLAPAQAANSRLYEVRNASTNLLIPTKLEVAVLPVGPVASPYLLELSAHKYTGFTDVDATATTTPAATAARGTMSAPPQNAQLRAVTASGVAAGMTGGTLGTKATNPFAGLLAWIASVSTTSRPVVKDLLADVTSGGYPIMFGQDEGFVIENTLLGSPTANNVMVYLDFAWCEAQSY